MIPTASVKELNFKDYLNILDKRKWIIITIFVIYVTTVAFVSFWTRPVYMATAVILIERQSPKVLSVEQVYSMGYADKEYYETQYKILRSRTLVKRLFEDMNLFLDPEFSGEKDPVDAFASRIIVSPVKGSRLVNLGLEGEDPQRITTIVNALAELYIKLDSETKNKASKDAVTWLMEQIESVKNKLQESEGALINYMEQEKITGPPESEKKETKETLVEILRKEQMRLEVEIAETSKRYGPNHPQMIKVLSELGSIRSKLDVETQVIIDLNRKSAQYVMLKREVDSNREIYENLIKRAKETGISEQLQASNIRIIDSADVPEYPVRPNRRRDIMKACLVAFILGFSVAFFIEYLDNTIKEPDDVNMYIGLPFLGYVPSCRKEAKAEEEIDLIVHRKPRSVISEAYRSMRTSILFAFADKPAKTLLITSSQPQEGKTTSIINLGTTMAATGERVLLVDADMRCSRLHKSFGFAKEGGLSDYLVGNIDLEKAIKPTTIENLFVLTAGSTPPNPAELLQSGRMKTFLDEAKKKFDRVVIDVTPILTVTDAAILANRVDGVVMLVRCGKIPVEVVLRAKQKLQDAKANILGVLLNNVDYGKESYYYYYYYTEEDKNKA